MALTAKMSLEGRNIVVTGGARGIGLDIARSAGEAGAHVVIADIDASVAGRRGQTADKVPLTKCR